MKQKFNFKYLTLMIILFANTLYANVTLDAPNSFYKGDPVVFSITAQGDKIELPNITKIDDILVQGNGMSTSTSIINGARSQTIKKTYLFRPTNTITIPPFDIKIDGKIFTTKPHTIKAQQVQQTVSPYFDLKISVDKLNPYVGEAINFKLIFKYRKDLQLVDLQFVKPQFENFWAKEVQTNTQQKNDPNFVVQELNYLLFPQKSGTLTIEPVKIDVITADTNNNNYGFFRSQATKRTPVYSNDIILNATALPQDIKLIGDFKISATIDKQEINQGDAISYKLIVEGRGNLDDIEEIKVPLTGVTIYDNPSKKDYNIKNGRYGGTYTKTYSIVATENFTIPSIEIKYFDKRTKTVKTTQTKEYTIKVNGVKKATPQLQVSNSNAQTITQAKEKIITKVVETSDNQKLIYFLLGMIVCAILISFYHIFKNRSKNKEELPLEKEIKSIHSIDELLKKLVIYINIDKELDKIIYRLENEKNSENKKDLKVVKKEILNIIKEKQLKVKF